MIECLKPSHARIKYIRDIPKKMLDEIFFKKLHSVRDIFCKEPPNSEIDWTTPATPRSLNIKVV